MRKAIFAVLALVLLTPSLSIAQEDTVECEPDLATVQTTLDDAQAALDEGDTETALSLMNDARNQLALAEAECSGLVFTDDKAVVIGPVFIEEGIYRAIATTEGYFILQVTTLEGECGAGSGSFLTPAVFLVSAGEADEGAEAVFSANEGGCEALLEVSNVQSEWVLTFEKLN